MNIERCPYCDQKDSVTVKNDTQAVKEHFKIYKAFLTADYCIFIISITFLLIVSNLHEIGYAEKETSLFLQYLTEMAYKAIGACIIAIPIGFAVRMLQPYKIINTKKCVCSNCIRTWQVNEEEYNND